jgi:hypothetical protein
VSRSSQSCIFGGTAAPDEPICRQVNHWLHFRLTLATFGAWAVLVWWWLPLYVWDRNQRERWNYLIRLAQHEKVERERQRSAQRLRTRSRTALIMDRNPTEKCSE